MKPDGNDGRVREEQGRSHGYLRVCTSVSFPSLKQALLLVHVSSMHQACIVNKKEHDDMMVSKKEKLNTCKKELEEIKEM
jgi:hypothetical protein